jgi:hypothetical protein
MRIDTKIMQILHHLIEKSYLQHGGGMAVKLVKYSISIKRKIVDTVLVSIPIYVGFTVYEHNYNAIAIY